LAYLFVANRETRVESWALELVSPLPQEKGKESGGIPGQPENYRARREWMVVFSRLGKEH
jgi:hypothetical protein